MALQLGAGPLGRILGAVVALALAGGAYLAWNKVQEKVAEAGAPEIGNCLQIEGSTFDADHEEVDCADAGATYKVVGDDGSCDKHAETNYTITLDSGDEGNVADLCLALNAAKGDCFKIGGITSPETKVDCKATVGDRSVGKVVAAGDDASGTCPKGSKALRNKTRDTLICLGANV